MINCQPLTYVYDDSDGISYALTSAHLIYGRNITSEGNDQIFEILSTHESLRKRAKHHRKVLKEITSRWSREYLLSIREVVQSGKGEGKPQVEVGEVVIIKNGLTKLSF